MSAHIHVCVNVCARVGIHVDMQINVYEENLCTLYVIHVFALLFMCVAVCSVRAHMWILCHFLLPNS